MKKITLLVFALFVHTVFSLYASQDTVQFVNDYAQILEVSEKRFLEERLKNYAKESGIKIYFGNVKSVGRTDIEKYAYRLFDKLPISEEARKKTLVVLISKKEMQGFICEGEHLRRYFSNDLKQKMIRSLVIQAFKNDHYLVAYELLFTRMRQLFSEKITPKKLNQQLEAETHSSPGIFFYLQFIMFVLVFVTVFFLLIRSIFHRKNIVK